MDLCAIGPGPSRTVTAPTIEVLWFEWTPCSFSPQTVLRAVWSGNLNRFSDAPSAPSITTVSKRISGGIGKLNTSDVLKMQTAPAQGKPQQVQHSWSLFTHAL